VELHRQLQAGEPKNAITAGEGQMDRTQAGGRNFRWRIRAGIGERRVSVGIEGDEA